MGTDLYGNLSLCLAVLHLGKSLNQLRFLVSSPVEQRKWLPKRLVMGIRWDYIGHIPTTYFVVTHYILVFFSLLSDNCSWRKSSINWNCFEKCVSTFCFKIFRDSHCFFPIAYFLSIQSTSLILILERKQLKM